MAEDTLGWYSDADEDFDDTFALCWKLRRGGADEDDLGSAEFRADDQRWWGYDYTKPGPAPANCCTFGPFEQLADAQNAVEQSVGSRTLVNRATPS